MAKNLFVGSLPFSVNEDALGQLFAQCGQVQSVNIIKDKFSGTSRGFAFVEMGTDDEAKAAIEKLNGHDLDGRNIIVKEALPKPTYTNGRGGGRDNRRGGGGFRGGGGSRY
jgi:cold-inducible RNA-binding protein